jgi:hypothetical protein
MVSLPGARGYGKRQCVLRNIGGDTPGHLPSTQNLARATRWTRASTEITGSVISPTAFTRYVALKSLLKTLLFILRRYGLLSLVPDAGQAEHELQASDEEQASHELEAPDAGQAVHGLQAPDAGQAAHGLRAPGARQASHELQVSD